MFTHSLVIVDRIVRDGFSVSAFFFLFSLRSLFECLYCAEIVGGIMRELFLKAISFLHEPLMPYEIGIEAHALMCCFGCWAPLSSRSSALPRFRPLPLSLSSSDSSRLLCNQIITRIVNKWLFFFFFYLAIKYANGEQRGWKAWFKDRKTSKGASAQLGHPGRMEPKE